MNFNLSQIPERTAKPREQGITMVMDKGLSIREAEDFISMSEGFVDLVKIGFGTAYVSNHLKQKIKLYQNAGMACYFGGTLFEAFYIRNQYDDYKKVVTEFGLTHLEVSDGSMEIEQEKKYEIIADLAKDFTVLSEVGSKDAEVIIPPYKWILQMQSELDAGSWKVIAEAREAGNVGIFRGTGEVRSGLIEEILTKIPQDKIIWEAPMKSQQVWFVKHFGHNVNLGNIAPNEAIPLETIRLGLRGDTFFDFLDKK